MVHTVPLEKGTSGVRAEGRLQRVPVDLGETQYLYCFDTGECAAGMPGIAFNPLSPDLGIEWPLPVDVDDTAQISAKDRSAAVWTRA